MRIYIIVVAYISYACIAIKICICGVDNYACITYMECVYMLNVHIVTMVLCPCREKRLWFPTQIMYYCVWGCHGSTPCSGVSCIYEAHICISVNTFFHYSYFIQEHILLIVHIFKSMICRVYSVRIRHLIIYNAYTCTSHLTYTRIAYFVKIHTGDLYVNGWAAVGGWKIYFVSLSRMITDKFLTEMSFSDVAEIEILYNNERNNADKYVYNMTTHNDCLMELDADHNTLENCTVKKCNNYYTSLEFNKTFGSQNNIYILHLNICSSQHKLTDLTYYLEN